MKEIDEPISVAEDLFQKYVKEKERGNTVKAIEYLEKAAEFGIIHAIYTLAYEYDTASPRNDTAAVKLYKKAIRMGDALSAWNLAKHYQIRNDVRWYRYWMRKASEMGMEEAIDELAK